MESSTVSEGIGEGLTTDGATCPPEGCNPPDLLYQAELTRLYNLAINLTIGCYIPILILGLLGNSVSFCIMVKKAWRSSTYCYLSSLCVMDNIFLLSSVITWVTYALSDGRYDLRVILNCNFLSLLQRTPREVSAWLLVAVSMERLLVVYLPTRGREICDVRRARVVVLMIVVAMLIIGWENFGGYKTNNPGTTDGGYVDAICEGRSQVVQDYINTKLYWVKGAMYSYIPSLLILASNVAIIARIAVNVWKRKRAVAPNTAMPAKGRTFAKASRRMTLIGLTLSFAFLALTLPSTVNSLYYHSNMAYLTSDPIRYYNYFIVDQILSALFHLNHAINFALYCLTSSKFRADLMNLLKCRKPTHGSVSGTTGNTRTGTTLEKEQTV